MSSLQSDLTIQERSLFPRYGTEFTAAEMRSITFSARALIDNCALQIIHELSYNSNGASHLIRNSAWLFWGLVNSTEWIRIQCKLNRKKREFVVEPARLTLES